MRVPKLPRVDPFDALGIGLILVVVGAVLGGWWCLLDLLGVR